MGTLDKIRKSLDDHHLGIAGLTHAAGVYIPASPDEKPLQGLGVCEFPVYASDPLKDAHLAIDACVREAVALDYVWNWKYQESPAFSALLAGDEAFLGNVLLAASARHVWNLHDFERLSTLTNCGKEPFAPVERQLFRLLPKRSFPYDEKQLLTLTHAWALASYYYPFAPVLRMVERFAKKAPLSPAFQAALRVKVITRKPENTDQWFEQDKLALSAKIETLLGKRPQVSVERGEAWADAFHRDLEAMTPERRAAWEQLAVHMAAASSSAPSAKWLSTARERLAAVGTADFQRHAVAWIKLLGEPRTQIKKQSNIKYCLNQADPSRWFAVTNETFLRGFAWTCSLVDKPAVAAALFTMADTCLRPTGGQAQLCGKAANGAIYALGAMSIPEAVQQLTLLKPRIKIRSFIASVDKALAAAAKARKTTVADLEETSVPTFGLKK